jgi:aspartate/glutamate racemase
LSRIGLIHATPLAVQPIAASFAALWPQARLHNILDDSLSVDRAHDGRLTEAMTQRFIDLSHYAVRCGCEALLFTCSAFGPAIEAAAARCGVPTFKPNEAMFDAALALAKREAVLRIGLLATFEPSIASMAQELQACASQRGLRIAIEAGHVPEAMDDLQRGQAQLHHQKIAQAAAALPACDVIMLAQFSMAAAQPLAQRASNAPVLSSPDCAVTELRRKISHV